MMTKAAKPNFQHSSAAVQTAPRQPQNNGSKQRKRVAMQTGVYKDRRAKKHGQMRTNQAMTEARWKRVIASIANGRTRVEAAKVAGITVQTIDAYLISNIAAYKQLRDAILLWNRRDWPSELIEQIFDDLAMGSTLRAAALKHGVSIDKLSSLYKIVRKDKQIREAYDEARELQAESFLDEIIDIADDSENDRLENGRINHEVVNRSKIRIETRRFAMGSMVKKRFGDHKHIEHEGSITLNHIAMLTGARKRLEKHRPGANEKTPPVLIDEKTGEVVAEQQ